MESTNQEISQAEAAKYLLRLKKARDSYQGFLELLYPDMEFTWFQIELMDILDRLEKGTLKKNGELIQRLMINMPPRHGKSFTCTEHFPAYFLAKRASREVMSVTYGQDLSDTFGRKIREVLQRQEIRQVFPELSLSKDTRAVDFWKTTEGGVYYGLGIGGSTTGRGANLLIVDDPFKNRTEAESQLVRNRKWQDYVSSLISRKQPDRTGQLPIEIVIMTRWHPDDISGRIMNTYEWKAGEWMHICYKAINKRTIASNQKRHLIKPDDPAFIPKDIARANKKDLMRVHPERELINTEEEYSLWEKRFPLETLKKMQRMDKREFEALYQQEPYVAGGNTMKTSWFQRYNQEGLPNQFASIVIACDTAFKTKTKNDYSVFAIGGICPKGDIYLLDVYRQKLEFPELKKLAIQLNAKYRGKGLRGMYIEDKASGQSLIQALKTESGIAVLPWKSMSDKVARANSVTPLIEGGRVFLPEEAHWLDDFITELEQFPNSPNDDQVDALVILLDVLAKVVVRANEMLSQPIVNLVFESENLAPELRFDAPLRPAKNGWQGDFGSQIAGLKWKGFGE